tara:strand:+ start:531 stop:758 length:228 start_codon:yes stop_codon:yes gene_type:complete
MSKYLKVEGHNNLVRDSRSHAIVNSDTTSYSIYMQRVRAREQQGDQIRNAVKEINTLKTELREIKSLIKELVNGS